MSLALTGATAVVALSTVDLMVSSPGRAQSSGGTLAIGASPSAAAAVTHSPGLGTAGRSAADPGSAGPRAEDPGSAGHKAAEPGSAGGMGRTGAGPPIALGIVNGTGRPGALAGVRGLLPAAIAAPELVSGLPRWGRCAHTFLGAAPAAKAEATSLVHQVPALRGVRIIALPPSLPKPLTARPVLFLCEDFVS